MGFNGATDEWAGFDGATDVLVGFNGATDGWVGFDGAADGWAGFAMLLLVLREVRCEHKTLIWGAKYVPTISIGG